MVKSDKWIKQMALEHKLIEPFVPKQIRDGNISFGASSYGYDVRLSDEIMVVDNHIVLDPKKLDINFTSGQMIGYCDIPPHSSILGKTLEYFRIPRDILGIAFLKSTYARLGLIGYVSPLEPEWEGVLTLSLINPTQSTIRVYANEGITQIVFLQADDICEISYADRKGKYQFQKDITLPRV